MWFKRKRKADPDSALTETLRSLQTLLEEEDIPGSRLEPILPSAPVGERKSTADQAAPVPDPTLAPADPASADIEPLAEEQSSPTTDFEFDLVNNEATDAPAETEQDWVDSFQIAEPEDTLELTTVETPSVNNQDMDFEHSDTREQTSVQINDLNFEHSATVEQTSDQNQDADFEHPPHREFAAEHLIESSAFDSIPVLSDIVFELAADPPEERTEHAVDKESIIDAAVLDLNQRLEQNNLASIDAEQERKLRRVLRSILL